MRLSENYNLNLAEGTDVVNPLVVDVPNYEKIDLAMKENSDNGIPVATELLTGTVHSLTRTKPDAPMFRFVATSKYSSGDTFTVDGVQVTALLTTGEPLKDGAYVINANVICCLVGTVLTLFCGQNNENVHAIDSDSLGGKAPNYYASAESVVEAINLAQSANQISLNNAKDITKLEGQFNFDSEEVIIGKWYDGKPVCRRTLVYTLDETWKDSTSPELKKLANSLPGNITIIEVNGVIGGYMLPYMKNHQPSTYFEYVGPNTINVRNSTNWVGYNLVVNVIYIKRG